MDRLKYVFLIVYAGAILIEIIWAWRRSNSIYNLKDSLSNFSIVLVAKLLKPLTLAWSYFVFSSIEHLKLFEIPMNAGSFVLTFLLVELIYYWYHRLSHEWPVLWVLHHTHHSSPWFNFTTAGRLNWFAKFTSALFYVPMVLIGFDPALITVCLGISLVYQIFIHTEMIGKLGWLEGVLFNTPSAHRVHHASNEEYIDKNYGGVLIIWDRLFGTYVPERQKTDYGVTSGFIGHNPLRIIFIPIIRLLKGEKP